METAGATEQKIHDRAKQMAVYAYDSRKITDQDFHLGYSTFSGKEDEIDLNQLENFLKDYSKKYPDVLNSNSGTNFRRLIRIYDWLKYGK